MEQQENKLYDYYSQFDLDHLSEDEKQKILSQISEEEYISLREAHLLAESQLAGQPDTFFDEGSAWKELQMGRMADNRPMRETNDRLFFLKRAAAIILIFSIGAATGYLMKSNPAEYINISSTDTISERTVNNHEIDEQECLQMPVIVDNFDFSGNHQAVAEVVSVCNVDGVSKTIRKEIGLSIADFPFASY